jgi:uncharacterized membrane protein YqjE
MSPSQWNQSSSDGVHADSNGVQRVLSDIVELCELQWQLLNVDGQEAKRRAVKAAIVLAVATCVALAGLLSATIGLGWLLHEQSEIPVGLAFLMVAGVALVFAVLAGVIGLRLLAKASESLNETKREFAENVRWIKGVVLHPKTSARNQLRRESFSTACGEPERTQAERARF